MRHKVDGRKFGRNTSHRIAMFRNLANSVIQEEQIVTTVQKAKETRRVVDRLITLAKAGTLSDRRLAFDRTRDREVVTKLFNTLADRYKGRAGGYTRVLRLSDRRWGDSAEMAVLELVDHPVIDRKKKPKAVSADGETQADSSATASAPVDPFSRFRRMFGQSKKKAKSAAGAGEGKKAASAKKAARKPAKKTKTAAE